VLVNQTGLFVSYLTHGKTQLYKTMYIRVLWIKLKKKQQNVFRSWTTASKFLKPVSSGPSTFTSAALSSSGSTFDKPWQKPQPRLTIEAKHLVVTIEMLNREQTLPQDEHWAESGNTKVGSITVPLTSCLTGLESAVWQLTIFVFICKTD